VRDPNGRVEKEREEEVASERGAVEYEQLNILAFQMLHCLVYIAGNREFEV
jgi:isoprenylcysteine carboxyl methyltransferase (ICMT) family protein YpbQ